jgi:hypothetical protein
MGSSSPGAREAGNRSSSQFTPDPCCGSNTLPWYNKLEVFVAEVSRWYPLSSRKFVVRGVGEIIEGPKMSGPMEDGVGGSK